MLCERCNEREANVGWTSIIEGKTSQMVVCRECFENHYPTEFAEFQAKVEAGCSYCGKKCGESICQRCLAELQIVMEEKGISFKQPVDSGYALKWVEVMEHMKKWAANSQADKSGENSDDQSQAD